MSGSGVDWGIAASATEAMGAAPRSDWARWEALGKVPHSAAGNGFATRYREDLALFARHGLRHLRLTLDWSRLEPDDGRPDPAAHDEVAELLRAAREAGVAVWATLHDVALPGWFAEDLGGFADERARGYHWLRHVERTAEAFGDLVAAWVPIASPEAWARGGYLVGARPPGRRDDRKHAEALEGALLAQGAAWRALRGAGVPVVGSHTVAPLAAADRLPASDLARGRADRLMWEPWTRARREGVLQVPGLGPRQVPELEGAFDLIGLDVRAPHAVDGEDVWSPWPSDAPRDGGGSSVWPEAVRVVLERAAEELGGCDLAVTSWGIGTVDDDQRAEALTAVARHVDEAVADGLPVRAVFHRTGVDGYAFEHGFAVPFGCFDRDRAPKGSAEVLAGIAAAGRGGES